MFYFSQLGVSPFKRMFILTSFILLFTACKKDNNTSKYLKPYTFANVVILGNSITYAPQNLSIGWNNNCGMAATQPENDYVHLLTGKLRKENSRCTVTIKNISNFEREYSSYDFDGELKLLTDLKPDLLIIRIGENVDQASLDSLKFDLSYQTLIKRFKAVSPSVKILAVGSFWGNKPVDNIMQNHSKWVGLSFLMNDLSNQAFGIYTDLGVAAHPSDKGMKAISNVIWDGITGFQ